ncbi:MAG: UvrD-helicase domain-containing protein [Gammaproteobacteria bacterium]|nr:UvrD-helicase domain-containing protein [Gammaproteobacteria bacterium]
MTQLQPAVNPRLSATVSASAGTGKTWLLVTRLVRLLLVGARPEGILAVTFTRKAAAEMQTRLSARLLELARCPPEALDELLGQMGAPQDETTRICARTLYEKLLGSPSTVKTTTFHSFCQDILRRFPLEAGIAPGFELLESSAEWRDVAWEALCDEASRTPDGNVAQALEVLFSHCDGLSNTTDALNSFVAQRSDWWAYTEMQDQPLDFALARLSEQMQVSPDEDLRADFFTGDTATLLGEFAALLQKHPTASNLKLLDALATARDPAQDSLLRFVSATDVFFTKAGTARARKPSKVQATKMGEDGQQHFLDLHFLLCQRIEQTREKLNAQQTLERVSSWYRAGVRLLDHFQRLKEEQRVLDFADLEWRAYQLLNHGDNVHWIQYKLDQRLDHLLIDEFQDTNPTQWRLLLPLLQELASGEDERRRSVFLVGDNKQSIYRFRRADPALFDTAQRWLSERLHAISQPLDVSWRSADAIMQFVNKVFGEGPLGQHLAHFTRHATHHPQLWGQVEFLPLVEAENTAHDADDDIPPPLRNPLQTPRERHPDQRHLNEGRLIAERIAQMMSANTLVGPVDAARLLRYSDIIILLRNRSHAASYEQALREASIPYVGANRGTLLESQEARDLLNLLELLVTPFNNLALANLLRSPLFDCDHDDLMSLASIREGHWVQRLTVLATRPDTGASLQRAHQLLATWREGVGKTPVHDLLDRIFNEGDVVNRYRAAYPEHLRHRVEANLTRFIELALEIDSGRYPSIGHFVARLRELRDKQQDAPDEGTPTQTSARVRLMTIHAAKGLEASVVFVADSSNIVTNNRAYQTLVDWPTDSPRPHCFLLTGKKQQRDTFTTSVLEQHAKAEAREDANLLYVAITRAKQFLYISGCCPSRGNDLGWYGKMQEAFAESAKTDNPGGILDLVEASGEQPREMAALNITPDSPQPPAGLDRALPRENSNGSVSPSRVLSTPVDISVTDPDGRIRGIAIHRMLQLLCEQTQNIPQRVANEMNFAADDPQLVRWFQAAVAVFEEPSLSHLFDPSHYLKAYNEIPLHYYVENQCRENQPVYGIIDRLVVAENGIWLVDYKTHAIENRSEREALAMHYRPQMEYYRTGIEHLWPGRSVIAGLLFTDGPVWMPL